LGTHYFIAPQRRLQSYREGVIVSGLDQHIACVLAEQVTLQKYWRSQFPEILCRRLYGYARAFQLQDLRQIDVFAPADEASTRVAGLQMRPEIASLIAKEVSVYSQNAGAAPKPAAAAKTTYPAPSASLSKKDVTNVVKSVLSPFLARLGVAKPSDSASKNTAKQAKAKKTQAKQPTPAADAPEGEEV